MIRKLFAVGIVALFLSAGTVAVLLSGGGLAFASGFGPGPDGDDGGEFTEFPTATPAPGSTPTPDGTGDGGDGTGSTATPVLEPFAVTIDRVEECGRTCRDVTVSLTNRQSDPASDVTVYTRVFAGNSTDEDDVVWRGTEDVGGLAAGETHTTTKRVELTSSEAYEVQQADGWITVQTTVQTDDRTITFVERRNVG